MLYIDYCFLFTFEELQYEGQSVLEWNSNYVKILSTSLLN